jgi:hypothetical protein
MGRRMTTVKLSTIRIGEWFKFPDGTLAFRIVSRDNGGAIITSGGLSMGRASLDCDVIPLGPEFQ